VDVDDVVEEVRAHMDVRLEGGPIHFAVLHVVADVDRTQITDVVWQEWLLAARVRRLIRAEVRNRVVLVRFVDEEDARLARAPRAQDHAIPDGARVLLCYGFATGRVDEVVA